MVHSRGISILLGFIVVFSILLMGSLIYWQVEQAKLNLDNARLKASHIELRRNKESLVVRSLSIGPGVYQLRIQNTWNEVSRIKSVIAIKDGRVIYVGNPETSVYHLSSLALDVKTNEKPDTFIVVTDIGNAFIANNPDDPSSCGFRVAYNLVYDPNEYQISASVAKDYLIVTEGPLDMGQQIKVLGLLIEFDWKVKLLVAPQINNKTSYNAYIITHNGAGEFIQESILNAIASGEHFGRVTALYFTEEGVYHLVKGSRRAKALGLAIDKHDLQVFVSKPSVRERRLQNMIIPGITFGDYSQFLEVAQNASHIICI